MAEIKDSSIRVNGVQLGENIGKRVYILGTVIKTDANGVSVELKTVDNQIVNIRLMEPTQGPLSGMVEFHGRVNSNNSLTSDFYVQFDENVVENFDPNQYNEAINFIHTIPNPWVCDDKERSMDM